MFNVGTPEMIVIFLVALIVLGPDKLPSAARKVGAFMGEIRRMSSGFQDDLRGAMQEPVTAPSAGQDEGGNVGPTPSCNVEHRGPAPGHSRTSAEAPTPLVSRPGPDTGRVGSDRR